MQGALSYYFIDDTFDETLTAILSGLSFEKITFLPDTLAQLRYLLPAKRREGYAVLLDVGVSASSVTVAYGDGIVHEETLAFGTDTIVREVAEKFRVSNDVAKEILGVANVSDGYVQADLLWTREQGDVSIPVHEINTAVKDVLDILCEALQTFFQKYYDGKDKTVFAVNPISITGEGVSRIAGLSQRLASRVNRLTETVCPSLPYYDKPQFSSRIALLYTALSERKKTGFLQALLNKLGGKK